MADTWVVCSFCGEALKMAMAYKEGDSYYHPECAGLWKCPKCGNFMEEGKEICACGAKRKKGKGDA